MYESVSTSMEVNERTSLLPNFAQSLSRVPTSPNYISIDALIKIQRHAPLISLESLKAGLPHDALQSSERVALMFLVLTYLLDERLGEQDPSSSIRKRFRARKAFECRKQDIFCIVEDLLNEFQGIIDDQALGSIDETFDMLLIPFSKDGAQTPRIRVIDRLTIPTAEIDAVLKRDFIEFSLLQLWRFGVHSVAGTNYVFLRRMVAMSAAPRTRHAVALTFYILYLGLLVNYTLAPALHPATQFGSDLYILLYSFTSLFRQPSIATLPFVLVFCLFATIIGNHMPPTSGTLSILFFSLFIHVMQLHVIRNPSLPTPLLLLPLATILPLNALILRIFSRAIVPAVTLFSPLLLATAWLISSSLTDRANAFFYLFVSKSPLETRYFYFVLFGFSLFLAYALFCALVVLVTANSSDELLASWDRYGKQVSRTSRRNLSQVVAYWSSDSSVFPPPLNILLFLFVVLPKGISKLIAAPCVPRIQKVESILGLILMRPLGLLLGVLWLWGMSST